ncbi:hypothetical protein [Streptomyces mexicanus]|uniref:hypothetical protein n=1 Tax=Streptomyces mexicanus TaxID=178566 RepID=UPI00367E3344
MRLRLREDAPGLLRSERTERERGWGRRLRTVAVVNVVIGFVFVPSAVANPFCYIPMVCEAKAAIDFAKDPLGFLLQKLTEANIWFLRKMLELIQNTTKIDLTSPGVLKQYAVIFAVSSLLTLALWLIAVAKRAVRGVPFTTAVGEAVGFLMLQFVVNAFTPGAIALLMRALDEVTAVFEPYATSNFKPFLENILKIMAANPTEGVGQLLVVNLITLCGALLMWVELLIRSAAVYVAVALGPIVNAGLVDRDLWGKSKKWLGAIFAIGLSKPVLFALLGLGGAILSDSTGSLSDAVSKTLVGALILLLAVFASGTLYKWVPAFGDEMAQLHHDRKATQNSGPAAAVDGPAQQANRAMSMHLQDSLVGGTGARGAIAPAVGGKGAASSTVGGQAGSAAAKAGAGARAGSGTGTMGGPIGAAATAVKAGVDVAKGKAESSPGAQGADATSGSTAQDEPGTRTMLPAAARARGADSDPVIGSGAGGRTVNGQGTTPPGTPATARGQGTTSAPVVAATAPQGAPPTSPHPPAPARQMAPPPASGSPTLAGPRSSSSPARAAGPPAGDAPIKPHSSKDQ